MPTNPAAGMRLTSLKAATVMTRTVTPVMRLERRLKPPVLMLMTLCPIMALPPIPPMSPAAMLPRPSPTASLLAAPLVLVIWSTSVSVIICSISATAASVPAVGKIFWRVSALRGGISYPLFHRLVGSSPVILPRSPIVLVSKPAGLTMACSTKVASRMPTTDDGIQWMNLSLGFLTRGRSVMVIMHAATSRSIHPAMSGSTHGSPSTKTS
mmetsp:Transcript_5394/g.13045  ORF Transcript_5394/g.13045 Transcript_5394/m.13045 type:complete len:211 (-) Transcript_5394:772-1404(-)